MGTRKKIAFALIPVVVLLLAAELIIRVTGAADHCSNPYRDSRFWVCDPILYFKLNPTLKPHMRPLNRDGFRTHEFSPKPPGLFRVLTLGDSCTFGMIGSGDLTYIPEPYAEGLERLVFERLGPGKVQVLNAGMPGYNSFQGLMLLRTKLRGLSPDVITVRFGWNDSFVQREDPTGRAFRETRQPLALGLEDLLLRTGIYRFVLRLRMDAQFVGAPVGKPTVADLPREWVPAIPLDDYAYNLGRIAEIGRERGAEVWFLTSPNAFATDENAGKYDEFMANPDAKLLLTVNALPSFERLIEIHDSYNAVTRKTGAALGVRVVDMDRIYKQHSTEHLFTNVDVVHPTQAGHDLEAEALYERLVTGGLIAVPTTAGIP